MSQKSTFYVDGATVAAMVTAAVSEGIARFKAENDAKMAAFITELNETMNKTVTKVNENFITLEAEFNSVVDGLEYLEDKHNGLCDKLDGDFKTLAEGFKAHRQWIDQVGLIQYRHAIALGLSPEALLALAETLPPAGWSDAQAPEALTRFERIGTKCGCDTECDTLEDMILNMLRERVGEDEAFATYGKTLSEDGGRGAAT